MKWPINGPSSASSIAHLKANVSDLTPVEAAQALHVLHQLQDCALPIIDTMETDSTVMEFSPTPIPIKAFDVEDDFRIPGSQTSSAISKNVASSGIQDLFREFLCVVDRGVHLLDLKTCCELLAVSKCVFFGGGRNYKYFLPDARLMTSFFRLDSFQHLDEALALRLTHQVDELTQAHILMVITALTSNGRTQSVVLHSALNDQWLC